MPFIISGRMSPESSALFSLDLNVRPVGSDNLEGT